jgi:hypothetical protein
LPVGRNEQQIANFTITNIDEQMFDEMTDSDLLEGVIALNVGIGR